MRRLIPAVLLLSWTALAVADDKAASKKPPLLFQDDFRKGAEHWQPSDAAAWKVIDADKDKVYSQFRQSKYKPPHRSPFNFSLVKDLVVGDVVLEARVRSTTKDYPHRDACLFFGYQDAAHFYYVHLGKKTDDHANQIFIVNDAPRKKISTKTSDGTPWTDDWHHVKVVRRAADGGIEVYFDDMKTPIMTATDKTFAWGQVGVGSFDDTSDWTDVKVYGRRAVKPPAKTRRPLAIEDLYGIDYPADLVLSPDGKRAAFVRAWIDADNKRERFSLWLVEKPGERGRPLEKGEPDARHPLFSPDGKWLVFLSTRPRPNGWKQTPAAPPQSEAAVDIWLLSVDGGETIPLAGPDKPYGRVFHDGFYGRLAFTPDGRRLAFVADDGQDPRGPDEKEADVYLVRPDQGEGYTGYRPAQIWLADLAAQPGRYAAERIERLTRDDVWYGDPQWSSDGRSLIVHANRTEDRESVRYSINKNFDLWAIDVRTRALRQLTKGVGPEVSPRLAPDGKRLVCLSVPRKGSHRDTFNLALVTLGDGGARTEILFDHHGPGADKPPHPMPVFPLPEDCWDGDDHLIYRAEKGTETITVRLNVRTGRGEELKLPAKGDMASVAGRMRHRQQFTPPGNAILRQRLLGPTRVVSWDNGEGMHIEGLLTTPPAKVAQASFPLVIYPHGGPHSRAARGFNFTVQTFAAQGYAVFQPNFRGSSGYGQKFIDADRFDFGGGDMRDILSGVDYLVRENLVDRERQFVYGVSYGGYMTCWLVGHTKQFRAAAAQNAVTDLNVMWGRSDLPSWTEWEFGGRPWEVPAAMRRHSPLTYAADVVTPTLILHSREDRRCPIVMGRMFHQALQARGVATRMVVYPGEGHGIRQPKHRADVLRRVLAWFAAHDKTRANAE